MITIHIPILNTNADRDRRYFGLRAADRGTTEAGEGGLAGGGLADRGLVEHHRLREREHHELLQLCEPEQGDQLPR